MRKKQEKAGQQTDPQGHCRTGQQGNVALQGKAESGNLYASETFNLNKILNFEMR